MIQQKIMGRIVKSLGGFLLAPQSGGPVVECRARGAFRQQNIKPCVGDWATVELTEQGTGYVVQLEPRSNSLGPPLANLTSWCWWFPSPTRLRTPLFWIN